MDSNHKQPVALLGIDWGTTNRRAYLLGGDGALLRRHEDEYGILKVGIGNFETSLGALLKTLGLESADIVMSGMVGSRNGWHQVPYLATTHPLAALPDALIDIVSPFDGVRCRIVPGYQAVDAYGTPDVMRGEETQIFGAMREVAADAWYLLPGTHSKWVHVSQGRITEIMTFMTGELFALLSAHGTLASLKSDDATLAEPFEAGLQAAQRSGFTHAAFGCRALVVTDSMPAAHASSYLSGLLIGAELAGIRQKSGDYPRGPVQIIGSPKLAARYAEALRLFDMPSTLCQPDDVYVAALARLAGITR
jgi:2-dehydro-3-deoxygalactonokinase